MRRLILVAAASLALSGCATLNKGVDVAVGNCATAIAAFQTVQALASVLEANGIVPKQAHALAEAAFKGASVALEVCPVLATVPHAEIERANARYGA